MRSKNTSDSKHLLSILIVIALSLAAWAVEESRRTVDQGAINDFLYVLSESHLGKYSVQAEQSTEVLAAAPTSDIVVSKYYRDVFAKSLQPKPILEHSIDLNSIDSISLEALPVFGPKLASRTVKYRDMLGGFVAPIQLLDVYGFDEEKLRKVESWFICDTTLIKKICVDTASWYTLKKHPYIGKSGATVISRYVRHNTLDQTSDLKSLPQMNDSTWNRWRPYIGICD